MRRLILNADDLGLTAGVNRAIFELHTARALTSATLMANAAATPQAIQKLCATPTLAVGCHIVLVDGQPLLPPASIPSLVDAHSGRLLATPSAFLLRLLTGRICLRAIEAEAAAQIASLQARGVRLTHIDTHKHLHIFPPVLRAVLRAARAAGIRIVRNPFEPRWSQRRTPSASVKRRLEVRLLGYLEPAFRRIVAEEGCFTSSGALGVLATGNLNATTLAALAQDLPPGCWELVTHPGYNDADLAQAHTRLLAEREAERLALLAMPFSDEIELVSFADLS